MRRTWLPVIAMCLLTGTVVEAGTEGVDRVWKSKCKKCHGDDGKGQTRDGQKIGVMDLSLDAWQRRTSDRRIRTVITNGSTRNVKMRAYRFELTPSEILALVRHIRGLQR